jgi:transketolase
MSAYPKFEVKLGQATREAFGRTVAELGRTNPNIVVLDADLSKSTMTTYFAKEHPERFFECGIAEANMSALAAGLAMGGKIPFAASFSAFMLNKGFEQLRCVVAYPGLNVKVVGTHSGISIGEDGPSQMSIEDLGLACCLAGFKVYSPADEVATAAFIRIAAEEPEPCFIRAGRVKAPLIYAPGAKFESGKAMVLRTGSDVTLMAHGLLVAESLLAADLLAGEGISAGVIDFPTIRPLDEEAIVQAASATGAIVVSEEHQIETGLCGRVAQVLARRQPCPAEFVGLTGYAESGTPDGLLTAYGLRAANVADAARRVVARKRA